MATRMKNSFSEFAFAGAKVGPDEVDFFHTYTVFYPSLGSTDVGTQVGTKSQAKAFGFKQTHLDYPRNLRLAVVGSSGSVTGGTCVINGYDQFGSSISETFTCATAADGGTVVGTKVFGEVRSGTMTYSSGCDAGPGTAHLGYGTAGTTTLFGLPFRLGGTDDVVNYAFASVSAAQMVGSASIGSYVSTAQNAILARTDFGTASGFTVWVKATRDQSNDGVDNVGANR